MASGSKNDTIFTRDNDGSGPSKGEMRSMGGRGHGPSKVDSGGTEDLVSFPQDNVHGVELPDTRGGKVGGGVTNLSHSLTGVSAVQK